MDEITETQIKEAVVARQIKRWPIRACSVCGSELYFTFSRGAAFFDRSCGCTGKRLPVAFAWSRLAKTFNRQTPEARKRAWEDFLSRGRDPVHIAGGRVSPGVVLRHHSGRVYTVLHIANFGGGSKFPETAVYQGANGEIWARPLEQVREKFTVLYDGKQLAPEEAGQ